MTNPTKPFRTDATNEEKLSTLLNDKRVLRPKEADTFHTRQMAETDLEYQGRFAQAVAKATINLPASQFPKLPDSAWPNQAALVGDEPPLGYVDEPPVVGEPWEVEASLERSADQSGLPSHADGLAWRRLALSSAMRLSRRLSLTQTKSLKGSRER
jgi:hypothetical protein